MGRRLRWTTSLLTYHLEEDLLKGLLQCLYGMIFHIGNSVLDCLTSGPIAASREVFLYLSNNWGSNRVTQGMWHRWHINSGWRRQWEAPSTVSFAALQPLLNAAARSFTSGMNTSQKNHLLLLYLTGWAAFLKNCWPETVKWTQVSQSEPYS